MSPILRKLAEQLVADRLRDAERVRLSEGGDRIAGPRAGKGVAASTVGLRICPDLVDRLIDLYCDWRTDSAAVQAAYERFSSAHPSDRRVAFAAYAAALDREESACEAYAAQIRLITSRCAADAGVHQPAGRR